MNYRRGEGNPVCRRLTKQLLILVAISNVFHNIFLKKGNQMSRKANKRILCRGVSYIDFFILQRCTVNLTQILLFSCACCCKKFIIHPLSILSFLTTVFLLVAVIVYAVNNKGDLGEPAVFTVLFQKLWNSLAMQSNYGSAIMTLR